MYRFPLDQPGIIFQAYDILEVEISDHHEFIVTTLKNEFSNGNPKIRLYYKNFGIEAFKKDLVNKIKQAQITDYSYFQNLLTRVSNKHALLKKKILGYNNNPFLSKYLRKAIIFAIMYKIYWKLSKFL